MKITIDETVNNADKIVLSEVQEDIRGDIQRRVDHTIDLREFATREALKRGGWIDPETAKFIKDLMEEWYIQHCDGNPMNSCISERVRCAIDAIRYKK